MSTESVLSKRLRAAWQGRISGCQLGKPVEVMSALQGHDAMNDYLASAGALPLRDYVPIIEGAAERGLLLGSCKGPTTISITPCWPCS